MTVLNQLTSASRVVNSFTVRLRPDLSLLGP